MEISLLSAMLISVISKGRLFPTSSIGSLAAVGNPWDLSDPFGFKPVCHQ